MYLTCVIKHNLICGDLLSHLDYGLIFCIHSHSHTCTHTHARTLAHIHTHTHTCTHTQIHTHTHYIGILGYMHYYIHRYLQEYTPLGTAGGLYHFRDQIARTFGSETSSFFVLNSDVCCDFPLCEMIDLHKQTTNGTGFVIMGTKVCLNLWFK